MNSIYVQARKFQLPVELIIVEWNPPTHKPQLKDVLAPPPGDVPVRLRYVVVPKELHDTYMCARAIPLYQMIAKNVGIRRATGKFILCTNIDILFSDECFRTLAKRDLQKGVFYRSNRCDVPKEVMDHASLKEQLAYAEKNIIRRLGNTPGHEVVSGPSFFFKYAKVATLINTLIVKLWQMLHPGRFTHFLIDFMACGDFTLMSREDWIDIDGYAELDMYSIHIDSMGLWSACALGKEQVILPYRACIYHIDHEDGWESNDIIKTIRFLANKPCLDYSIVHRAGMKMVAEGTNWELNRPDWGWADKNFEEHIFDGNLNGVGE